MKICIVRHGQVSMTETFIRAHAERLPGDVTMVCGSPPRIVGEPDSSVGRARRLAHRAWQVARGRPEHERYTPLYRALLARLKPDVVLAEYGPNAVRVLGAVKALDIPLIAHFHGYDASNREVLEQHREGYREVFEYASAVVGVSRTMCDTLVGLGAPLERVHHNPCGVDIETFTAGDPAGAPPVFVAAGRLVDKKAPHLLLLAHARVRQEVPDAKLRILGDGPLRGVCEDLTSALGLNGSVDWLGPQPHDRVRREMARSRAFVQHSVVAESGDSEGTPVAVMEAGAAGLPVIATRHAGIPDVVVDARTGLLVEERDVEGMARAMVRVAKDPELARCLGGAARRRVAERFSMERSIRRLASLLREAAAHPPAPSRQSRPLLALPAWIRNGAMRV